MQIALKYSTLGRVGHAVQHTPLSRVSVAAHFTLGLMVRLKGYGNPEPNIAHSAVHYSYSADKLQYSADSS